MSRSSDIQTPRSRWRNTRRTVQLAMFLLFLSPLLISGWSLWGLTAGGDDPLTTPSEAPFYGSLSSSQLGPIELIDPFVTLQVIAATKSFDASWLFYALPLLLLFGLIGARVFCGWICPVNLFLEGLDFVREKLGIKLEERVVPRRAKVFIALGIVVLSAIISVPLFETFSPISAVNKFFLFGSTAGLISLALIVVMELFWGHRVWCRALCPLGGFYQAIGRIGILKVRIEKTRCTHCESCKKVCIVDPEILEPAVDGDADYVFAGDCMLCGKCIDVCPAQALLVKPTLKVSQGTSTPQLRSETID